MRTIKDRIDLIWERIINSAKSKIDYASFSKSFNEIVPDSAEHILINILEDIANEVSVEIIALKIKNNIMVQGYMLQESQLQQLIEGILPLIEYEILAIKDAVQMVKDGEPISEIEKVVEILIAP
jgi:hypothetical protein